MYISKIEDFFLKNTKQYDIVLFLSILHHYVIGKENYNYIDILKNLDKITKNILFLDTGENHEQWNKLILPEWNVSFIIKTIKNNTSFKTVIPLGRDHDNKGIYKDNYRRMMFACLKN